MRCLRVVSMLVVVCALAGSARADFLRVTDPNEFPNPTPRAFGNVQVGANTTATVTLKSCDNNRPVPDDGTTCAAGGGSTSIAAFSFGAGCGEFTYVGPVLPLLLTNSTSQVFTFGYTPTNRGTDTCVVTTTVSGGDDTPASFTLTGTGIAAELVIDPTPVVFGDVAVGDLGNANVTLRNPGENSLTIVSLTISGANAADYSFTNQGCIGDNPCDLGSGLQTTSLMSGGGSAVFGLRCTPSAPGARIANLAVTTNDPVSPTRSASLSCTGRVAELQMSAASHGFGNQRVGTTSAPFTFTIANAAGAAPLVYAISAAAAPRFTLSCPGGDPDCLSRTLQGGQSTTFDVTFSPIGTGMVSQTLSIDTNDPTPASDDPFIVALTGTGVESVVSAAALDLGNVPFGSSSTQDLVVSNVGTATLTISGNAPAALELQGGGNQFAIVLPAGNPACEGVQSCTRTIGPVAAQGGTTTIPIRCSPTAPAGGLQQANLIIRSDATLSPVMVPLRCTATVPDVAVSTMSLAFPSRRVGTASPAQTFTVDNGGSAPMQYDISETSPDFALSCGVAPCTGTLAAGGSITVSVTFTPTSAGMKMANVTVATPGDPDEMSTTVMVTGTGVEPLVTVDAPSPPPLALGDIDVGASASGTITLHNSGTALLQITAVVLIGGDAAEFAITAGNTGVQGLPINNALSWTVRCTPTSVGLKSTTFLVTHDGPTVGSQTNIAVTCTGRGAIFTPSVVAPAVLSFGVVQVGTSSMAQTFTLTNTGNKPGRIAMLTSTVNVFAASTMANLANDVAPGSSITVSVVFTPVDSSVVNAQVCGVHNGLSSPSCVGVTGDGASVGIDVFPAVDFGAVRFDAAPQTSVPVTIKNTGESVLQVTSITSAGAPFTIVNAPVLPFNLNLNETRTFQVRLTPTMQLGPVSRQISVGGTFTVSGTMASASIVAQARIVAPQVAMTADTLDFGAFDIDDPGAPVTRDVTLTNTGDAITGADLHVGAPVLESGAPDFAIVDGTPAIVPPGGSTTVTVRFDTANAGPKTGAITIPIDALGGMTYTVNLRALAVDQNVVCSPGTIMFPSTVRHHPSASIDATINNLDFATGAGTAAPLQYTATITGANADEFSLPAADAAGTVVGNGAKRLPITFTPGVAGAGRTATVAIAYTDNGPRSCSITLVGDGRLRDLAVMPADLDFGTIAVGSSVLLSEVGSMLTVTSSEPASAGATTIAKLEVTGDGASAFEVLGGDRPQSLPAGGSATYDVSFSPVSDGVFQADLDVYVDDDPDRQYTVHVTGRAVPLPSRGNPYSCAAGGEGAGRLWPVALIALALVARRRRNRRAR